MSCETPKLSAFKAFLDFWGKNPFKVAALFITFVAVSLSALAVVGLVLWFFVIHPEFILKALSL